MLRPGLLAAIALGAYIAVVPEASAAPVQCVPTPIAGAEQEIFKDVLGSSLGEDEAVALKNAGIPVECWASPLLFCPDCALTRAQMALFLAGAAKTPLVNPTTPTFTDVPTTSPYYQYVETAVSKGWTGGCGAGLFCPDEPVTRGQMAVFIKVASGIPTATPATPSYTDVPASHVFFKFVEGLKLVCAGAGCSATAYCPDSPVTRREAAVLVARAFKIWTLGTCVAYGAAADAGADGAAGAAGGGGAGPDAAAGSGGSGVGGSQSGGSTATGGAGGAGASPATGGKSGSGGTSGSASEAPSDDEGGCGCRAPGSTPSSGVAALAALAGLIVARRRPRRAAPPR